ncbi:MAG: hypothetical protein IT342_25455 [Candidatus Melainabacteria bacterium]|nr:hypothetical protein [Candidatus Melainabacteria bacterium]
MSTSVMYILIGVFIILGAVIIAATARRRPVDPEYRRNKLANELKWLKVGATEVERRIKAAKNCACASQASQQLESVRQYIHRAQAAVDGVDHTTILSTENELTAHQQVLANARSFLERAEREKCDIAEDGRPGGCRVNK